MDVVFSRIKRNDILELVEQGFHKTWLLSWEAPDWYFFNFFAENPENTTPFNPIC